MAHFHKMPTGERISTQTITVPGSTITIGLWGYEEEPGKELFVDWAPQVGTDLVRKGIVGNSRQYEVKGSAGTKVRLEAFARNGAIWDWCAFEFGAAGATASQAGKAVFATMDQCGIAALDEILSRSISEGMEYAGLIFKLGGRFGFTAPLRGEPDAALPGLAVPAGTATVGTYHTHGNKQGAGEIFSPQDRGFHNLRHWFAYLGTPTRAILRFTPKERPPDEHPGLAAFGGKAEKLR